MATRWAICGTGNIANDFCTTLKAMPETEHQIVAVAARDGERAASFAERFGIPRSFGSYEEMAAQDNIDIVYIATISTTHVENSLLFINAGQNVLCETPMAMSLEGAQRVLAAVKEKGVFFLEGYFTLFNPVYDVVRETIKSGEIGEVRTLQTNFSSRFVDYDIPRAFQVEMGGGVFMEVGCYQVIVANMIFGEKAEAVTSDLWKSKSGVDSVGGAILRYSNGRFAMLSLSDDTTLNDNYLIIRGTKGTIKIPDAFWSPTSVVLPNGEVKEFPLGDVPEGRHYIYPNCQLFRYEIQAVRDALNKGLKECLNAPHSMSEEGHYVMNQVLEQNNIKYPATPDSIQK